MAPDKIESRHEPIKGLPAEDCRMEVVISSSVIGISPGKGALLVDVFRVLAACFARGVLHRYTIAHPRRVAAGPIARVW